MSIGDAGRFDINLEDEVVRRSIVTHQGEVLWPAPNTAPPPTPVSTVTKPASLHYLRIGGQADCQVIQEEKKIDEATPWQKAVSSTLMTSGGMATALTLGKFTGPAFMNLTTTLGLAGIIGFRAVWNVAPALHSPLMCESEAIGMRYELMASCNECLVGSRWCGRFVRYGWRIAPSYVPAATWRRFCLFGQPQ